MSEKEIENAILEFLSNQKNIFAIKINTIGVFDPIKQIYRKSKSRYQPNGVSDIIGVCSHGGRMIALEVKTQQEHRRLFKNYSDIVKSSPSTLSKHKKHLQDQICFIEQVKKMGGIAGFVCSIATTIELFGDFGVRLEGVKQRRLFEL